jgi:hypothetical protein
VSSLRQTWNYKCQVVTWPCCVDSMLHDYLWRLLSKPILWLLVEQTTLLCKLWTTGCRAQEGRPMHHHGSSTLDWSQLCCASLIRGILLWAFLPAQCSYSVHLCLNRTKFL